MVSPLNLPTPAAVGDEWGNALNSGVQAVNADVETLKGRLITAGTGLLGGGSLAANRSLSVDFAASGAASAGKVVEATDTRLSDSRPPLAHTHVIGDTTGLFTNLAPLNSGGRLAADAKTITDWDTATETGWYKATGATNAPDARWYIGHVQAHSAGYVVQVLTPFTDTTLQTGTATNRYRRTRIASGAWGAWYQLLDSKSELDARYAAKAISLTAGSGLTGGGDLSASRTLAVDFATAAPLGLALAAAVGTAVKAAREDHVHPAPAWQAYTPTMIGGYSAGSGAVFDGRYVQIGKTVHFRARVKLGTGFTIGSGVGLSLPVARAASSMDWQANVSLLDTGSANYYAIGYMNATGVGCWLFGGGGAYAAVTPTAPFTWAANDEIWINGTYEAA